MSDKDVKPAADLKVWLYLQDSFTNWEFGLPSIAKERQQQEAARAKIIGRIDWAVQS